MKFIFSFLFGILILSPTFASYECTENTSSDQCTCAGWGWTDLGEGLGYCEKCSDREYSPASDSVCHDCIDSDGNWAEGLARPMHSIFDTNHATAGQSYCPWICNTDWYKNDAGTGCVSCPDSTTAPAIYPDTNNIGDCSSCPSNLQLIHANNNKYYCGQCGAGTPTTQGGITTCSCLTGANHINGNMPPQGNIRVECLCSGTFVDGQCVCPLNKYLHQDNNGVYSCESCPEHSTSAQGSTDVNDCQCNSNFPNRILDDENGKLIGCSACADNAVFDSGLCKCNYGYYGNGTSSCTQCPTGMTTNNLGAIDIASCVMKSNTKFCTVSQNRTLCLNFIPEGTQINYPGTTSH